MDELPPEYRPSYSWGLVGWGTRQHLIAPMLSTLKSAVLNRTQALEAFQLGR
jgi:hypothetical protein